MLDTFFELNAPPPASDPTYLESITCDSTLVDTFEFVILDYNGCDSIVIISNVLLLSPDAPLISSDLVIQENEAPFQISVADIPNATAYEWTVPVGVQILSGGNTNTIKVDWGSQTSGGSVCVNGFNECGHSELACMEVMVEIGSALNKVDIKDFAIFPNPTLGLLKVVFPRAVEGTYELRNLNDKLILKEGLQKETTVDLSSQPKGVYLLLLRTGDGVWVERIVKM